MGGLGHILESEGLPTTQISLIRVHTEQIRPPRALWVPFILGRPLGRPDDPQFQQRVLRAALGLLEAAEGPVLADFPEEAGGDVDLTGLACPISWAPSAHDGALGDRLVDEVAALRVWYDLSLERTRRTAFGTSDLSLEAVVGAVAGLARGDAPIPPPGRSLVDHVRFIAEDLKAFATEAAKAQPGTMSAFAIKRWLWDQSVTGEAIVAAYRASCAHEDANLRRHAGVLVPTELR